MNSLESFRIKNFIAAGGYGMVHSAIGPDGELVAMKQELASDKVTCPMLQHEYNVMNTIASHESIPKAITYGRLDHTNVLIMDLLGPSIGECFKLCSNKFSLGTTVHLALGMLNAVEYIHSQGFIHHDIKPSNFILGCGDKLHVVHLTHAALHNEGNFIGTPHCVSMYTHLGQEQTRRDDLHALTYTILSLAHGNLPWSCVTGGTKKHFSQHILKKKCSWTVAQLCQDLPMELQLFSSYCLSLATDNEPNYQYLRTLLATLATREECNNADLEWEERECLHHWYLNHWSNEET
ncbi:kinase-like domain-containing protein [Cyathus striatus]|nr:kinase-like domain-containing protein [Cyathus striatus]